VKIGKYENVEIMWSHHKLAVPVHLFNISRKMNNKKVHAKNAKRDAKISEPNFAPLCGFSWRSLREILGYIGAKKGLN